MRATRSIRSWAIVACLAALLASDAVADVRPGQLAPDFPPGSFTDGRQYSLEDFRGQVVVLFFYEKNCPSCAATIPERNRLMKGYAGKPVRFIAVAAGDSAAEARGYVRRTGLEMPVFIDSLSLMEKRYGIRISMRNIYQGRVIGADGKLVDYNMEAAAIDKALSAIKLPYNPADHHERIRPVIDALNRGERADAVRGLRRLAGDRDEAVKAEAGELLATLTALARGQIEEADAVAESDPFAAGKIYASVGAAFSHEDFGREAKVKLGRLRSHPLVRDEEAARRMYARLAGAVEKITPEQIGQLVDFARKIAEKYPDTPTGRKAAALADDLGA